MHSQFWYSHIKFIAKKNWHKIEWNKFKIIKSILILWSKLHYQPNIWLSHVQVNKKSYELPCSEHLGRHCQIPTWIQRTVSTCWLISPKMTLSPYHLLELLCFHKTKSLEMNLSEHCVIRSGRFSQKFQWWWMQNLQCVWQLLFLELPVMIVLLVYW